MEAVARLNIPVSTIAVLVRAGLESLVDIGPLLTQSALAALQLQALLDIAQFFAQRSEPTFLRLAVCAVLEAQQIRGCRVEMDLECFSFHRHGQCGLTVNMCTRQGRLISVCRQN